MRSGGRRGRELSRKGRREDVSGGRLYANRSVHTTLIQSTDEAWTAFVGMIGVVASAINCTLIDSGAKGRVASGTVSGLQSRAKNRRWGGRRYCHALDSSTINTFITRAAHWWSTCGGTTLHGTPSISSAGLRFHLFFFDRSCIRGSCAGNLCNRLVSDEKGWRAMR